MGLILGKLKFPVMFSHLYNQLWMDIMSLFLLMAEPDQERHAPRKDLVMIVVYMLDVFEESFDLSNSNTTSTSRFNFFVTNL